MDNNIDLDLDALEREGVSKPFSVKLGGRRYELVAIDQLDFRLATEIMTADVEKSLRLLLPDEDCEPFFKNDIPSFKMNQLFKAYLAHYNIDPGEADGSPPS